MNKSGPKSGESTWLFAMSHHGYFGEGGIYSCGIIHARRNSQIFKEL